MGTESGFEVQADAITRQATTVDEIADQVAQGRSAASAVTIGRDAYGFLCQLIPTLLTPLQEATVDALREATDSLQRSADDLRSTARAYQDSDDRTASGFRGGRGP
ncbi:type VII secretion target [Actinoplanes sp. M2I2]|uniref:type VII secretion target n=1 Tax=Actinoplanes sp. M2I2 TaxID=1734444 RepID=UPI00201FD0B3|nr:type VII secretion target [Actinoplanes sp. M2I2]